MAYVSRDPFGRTELHRKTVHVRKPITEAPVTGCAWCGSLNGRGNLYRYQTERTVVKLSRIHASFAR